MKKVLFVATVTGHIAAFHIPYLKMFKDMGYDVHVASNGDKKIEFCDKHFNIKFARTPVNKENFKAYKELKKVIYDNKYDIIHCHTPIGGALTRYAARKIRKDGTRVIYTAHGFHFCKGMPLRNWMIYYPLEKYLAKYTDCLITINTEDYERAKNFKAKNIKLVHGVGVNTSRLRFEFTEQEKLEYKEKLGFKKEDIILTYVAEINKNKNQIVLVNAVKDIIRTNNNVKLLLIGNDKNSVQIKEKIKESNLENYIFILGNRDDIGELLSITDIYVASSLREGLPVNIMEAMYMKLPVVASDNRGHRELIENRENGFIVNNSCVEFKDKIIKLMEDEELYNTICAKQRNLVKVYELDNVMKEMKKIYKEI